MCSLAGQRYWEAGKGSEQGQGRALQQWSPDGKRSGERKWLEELYEHGQTEREVEKGSGLKNCMNMDRASQQWSPDGKRSGERKWLEELYEHGQSITAMIAWRKEEWRKEVAWRSVWTWTEHHSIDCLKERGVEKGSGLKICMNMDRASQHWLPDGKRSGERKWLEELYEHGQSITALIAWRKEKWRKEVAWRTVWIWTEHHSIDCLKERGVEKGSGQDSTIRGWKQFLFYHASLVSVSRVEIWRPHGKEIRCIWALVKAVILFWLWWVLWYHIGFDGCHSTILMLVCVMISPWLWWVLWYHLQLKLKMNSQAFRYSCDEGCGLSHHCECWAILSLLLGPTCSTVNWSSRRWWWISWKSWVMRSTFQHFFRD